MEVPLFLKLLFPTRIYYYYLYYFGIIKKKNSFQSKQTLKKTKNKKQKTKNKKQKPKKPNQLNPRNNILTKKVKTRLLTRKSPHNIMAQNICCSFPNNIYKLISQYSWDSCVFHVSFFWGERRRRRERRRREEREKKKEK